MASAQPATLLLARELTRVIPFTSQKTFVVANLPASNALAVAFDIGAKTTDRNQLLGTTAPTLPAIANLFSAITTQFAIGVLIDALVFSTSSGTLKVEYAVDSGASYRTIATAGVAANTPVNISGLRITGRYVRVSYTDTSGAITTTVEFGAYVRSQ